MRGTRWLLIGGGIVCHCWGSERLSWWRHLAADSADRSSQYAEACCQDLEEYRRDSSVLEGAERREGELNCLKRDGLCFGACQSTQQVGRVTRHAY